MASPATTVAPPPAPEQAAPDSSSAPAPVPAWRRPPRAVLVAGVLVAWCVLAVILKNKWTLALAQSDTTALHRWFDRVNNWVSDNRNSNPVFLHFFNEISLGVGHLVTFIQSLISQPAYGRPVPVIGWLGVVALMGLLGYSFGNVRVAVLAVVGFVFLGLQGLWQDSMDTLALTLAAVLLALVIGLPLGILAGLSNRFRAFIIPILDFMQTMPSFVYLAPLALIFLIGPASATITTLIYALPPTVRFTAFGIREVAPTAVEAAESLGSTKWQQLVKVQLPMAKRTIVLGLNQTIMAALAMVTIAALIDAPGLGKDVVTALESLDVGTAFNSGLAIVVIAVVLDRMTTAASQRVELARRNRTSRTLRLKLGSRARDVPLRSAVIAVLAVVTVFLVYLSRTYLWAADFPDTFTLGGKQHDIVVGSDISRWTSNVSTWLQDNASGFTNGFKDACTTVFIDPLQNLLTESPWLLVALVVLALAWLLGDLRAVIVSAVCIGVLVGTGLWQDSMVTLAMTLIATVITFLLGLLFGVWMARNRRVDVVIRPILDALQVMPAFVYLVPFLALFSASRFTAIVAGVLYAAPVSIKIVADGVAGVSATSVEAATASGSSTWQVITKVQLPMARRSLVLALNQGLIYVLSMIVVGGLVGAQALGYDVVAGFSQITLFGKGLAAGLAIVTLGIMLNRISQSAAQRQRTS
jgi:glycine betaine/proline transport system permease protein